MKDFIEAVRDPKDLGNLHLRHSMLSALHSVLKNYMMCMDRDYFGPKTPQEIELTNNLHVTLKAVEEVMGNYYDNEAAILE